MKTIKIFSLLAVMAMAFVGCQEDDFGMGNGPARVGDEIIFGGTSGYSAKTRTVYGDKWADTDDKYTEIKWYTGDKVRIYCAEALPIANGDTEVQYCDYNVEDGLGTTDNPKDGTKDSDGHSSSLSPIGESGLKWGTAATHNFYGVYPAPGQLANENADALSQTAAGKLKLEGNKLTGYLPNRQTPLSGTNFVQKINEDSFIVHPAMRYAYMVAKTPVNTATSSSVSLSFDPVVTAVEITLVNNSADVVDGEVTNTNDVVNIQGFRVASDKVICGDFAVDIDTKINTVSSTEDTYKQVFIPAEIEKLAYGQSVTFTVFMMLDNSVEGLDNLTVTIITESGQKSAKLQGKNNGIIVQAKKKNFLNNVNLNLGVVSSTLNAGNWVAHIPNQIDGKDVLVRTLSIPGAGGAASYTQYKSHPEYAQQSLTISQQWAQGIRCFEFAVDLPNTDSGESFGEQNVICNGRSTGVKLKDAVDAVVTCLNNSPEEFAMVILTYENLNGWADAQDATRSPANFMSGLKTFWDKYSSVTALFNPAITTVESARGKLFCIARPTSAYYDDGPTISESGTWVVTNVSLSYSSDKLKITSNLHEHILIVNGWGSLKDKWEARGYTGNIYRRGTKTGLPSNLESSLPGRPFDASTLTGSWKDTDITQSNYTAQVTSCMDADAKFHYPIQLGTSTDLTANGAWVQEWARVSPEDAGFVDIVESSEKTMRVYWAPTIAEKEQRIEETLGYAIDKTKGEILYVNSLCGFFIDASITESYRPHAHTDRSISFNIADGGWKDRGFTQSSTFSGMEGNIDAYAKHINNYFYKLLTDKQAAGGLGSGMGIVLMDRVSSNAETDPAGYYIPQIIWTNNEFAVSATSNVSITYSDTPFDASSDTPAAPARR